MGLCPLFVFQGRFTATELNRLERGVRGVAADGWRASYGLEIFDVQLRRESIGTVLRVIIDRPGPRRAGASGRRGRHRGLPARQPRSERAARRRGRGARRGGARPELHARSFVAGAGSAAAARSGLPAVRGTAGEDRDDGAARRPVGVRRTARRRRSRARCCSKKGARRTGCRSRRSSAGSWRWNFRGSSSAVSCQLPECRWSRRTDAEQLRADS